MTTEPTDEDVERLLRAMKLEPEWTVASVRLAAHEALRSGEVTLAPKPEPRFQVERYVDGWAVRAQGETPKARWWDVPYAQQRAEALRDELNENELNGETTNQQPDETHRDVEMGNLRETIDRMSGELHFAESLAESRGQQLRSMSDYDSLAARVKELEAELAEARSYAASCDTVIDRQSRELINAKASAQEAREAAVIDTESYAAVVARAEEAERKLAWARGEIERLNALVTTMHDEGKAVGPEPYCERPDHGHEFAVGPGCRWEIEPEDTQPAEPLFTGMITTRGSRQHVDAPDVVIGIPGPKQDKLHLFARVGERVDVYPHGSCPAPRKVTAELTAEDVEGVLLDVLAPEAYDVQARADALNAILASKAGA